MKYATLTTAGQIELHDDPHWDHKLIQGHVGGWIEAVRLPDVDFYINEEGKLLNLPNNPVATALAQRWNAIFKDDYIAGDVVIVGTADPEGNNTDLPSRWREFLTEVLPDILRVARERFSEGEEEEE